MVISPNTVMVLFLCLKFFYEYTIDMGTLIVVLTICPAYFYRVSKKVVSIFFINLSQIDVLVISNV